VGGGGPHKNRNLHGSETHRHAEALWKLRSAPHELDLAAEGRRGDGHNHNLHPRQPWGPNAPIRPQGRSSLRNDRGAGLLRELVRLVPDPRAPRAPGRGWSGQCPTAGHCVRPAEAGQASARPPSQSVALDHSPSALPQAVALMPSLSMRRSHAVAFMPSLSMRSARALTAVARLVRSSEVRLHDDAPRQEGARDGGPLAAAAARANGLSGTSVAVAAHRLHQCSPQVRLHDRSSRPRLLRHLRLGARGRRGLGVALHAIHALPTPV
jgi:hypothetical protein